MTPHLHTSSASKSAVGGEMGAGAGQTTSKIENTERAVTTNGSSQANARVPYIDPQIHTVDVAQFAQFGFEEKAENIAKAMRVTAVKCAVSKIQRRVTLYGDGEDGDDEDSDGEDGEQEEEEEGGAEGGQEEENDEDKNEDKNEDKDVKDEDK
ncbi:hypothetical protein BDR03DRAFT_1011783 [Suillus americanus]|nr:hypothetical protein BDR03DRAFT_1011783 [Suillus americanus]